ncbi:MAG TPA: cellobiose phosphorylase [Anaerolineales bacterium]|nr:cellobiose phosphorylase [Anaerolineales bacterium]
MTTGWEFIDAQGTFKLPDPHHSSYLYFPLVNEAGMMSSVTPTLHGDAKTGQNTFLLAPASVEDLHNSRTARNFWVRIDESRVWSATGSSAEQMARHLSPDGDQVTLTAGFLWHTVERRQPDLNLAAEVTNFVPVGTDRVELMRVTLKNTGATPLKFTPTAAVPIYGRSADNLRDHRHVTSLLHRTRCHPKGVLVRPTLSFDERGHTLNQIIYAALGVEADGTAPVGFFADVESFIGEGGTLDWPEAVVCNKMVTQVAGGRVDGYEALGGIRFREIELSPGGERSYILILGILQEGESPDALLKHYGSGVGFAEALQRTKTFWGEKVSTLHFETSDRQFDGWLSWVTLQPMLRRLMGNSFLPYHDYGRGGRGWRDLWQDILALLITERGDVGEMLLANFAGVRADGSNATIIGSKPGEFKADRNNIPRVWMDHGAWPLLTTKLYIDQTGDLKFLLQKQAYFKDQFSHRCRATDEAWTPEQGTQLKTKTGKVYQGTVLEHLLIQHLTAFFNVGEHNILLLEGADWNDALDMARTRGESVAFSALYAGNLQVLAELCRTLSRAGVREVSLAVELGQLFNTAEEEKDLDCVEKKRARLARYFEAISHALSGEKIRIRLSDLADDLTRKSNWLKQHIRNNEWVRNGSEFGWFNGYYDDDGQPVEGMRASGLRMTLTGQVFALMCGIATEEQTQAVIHAVNKYLYDEIMKGYRLNTNFGTLMLNLGRAFGFAYGHKENGAMFNHMTVMYANALYKRGLVKEGWKVLGGIYRQSRNFERSRMYPGIPEYFSGRGRGMYTYLTGSASWYLFTLLNEVYGVKGELGNLVIEPKLMAEQFDDAGQTRVNTLFAGKPLEIVLENPERLDYGQYWIAELMLNGKKVPLEGQPVKVSIPRAMLLPLRGQVNITVKLSGKEESKR